MFYNTAVRLGIAIYSINYILCDPRLDPGASYKPSASEKAVSEEGEKRGKKKLRESQDGMPTKKGKVGSNKASRGYTRSQTQQRYC